jgi:hypothetical protein
MCAEAFQSGQEIYCSNSHTKLLKVELLFLGVTVIYQNDVWDVKRREREKKKRILLFSHVRLRYRNNIHGPSNKKRNSFPDS